MYIYQAINIYSLMLFYMIILDNNKEFTVYMSDNVESVILILVFYFLPLIALYELVNDLFHG